MYQDQKPLLSRLSDDEHPTNHCPVQDPPMTYHPSNNRMRSRKWTLSLLACSIALLIISGSVWSGRKYYKSHRDPEPPKFDVNDEEKALVVASTLEQDVSWLPQIPSDWKIYRYITDDPNSTLGLSVPSNHGHEAMAYLTYIIDNYDNLPAFSVFIHGHYRSWHQLQPLPSKIRSLNLSALIEEDYISFRCEDPMGCERQPFIDMEKPNWAGEYHLGDFWNIIMPNETAPQFISFKCCAQFAVTRKAIKTRSREDWIRIRDPLMHDLEGHDGWLGQLGANADWQVGTFYERIWHMLFGMPSQHCPATSVCDKNFFQNAYVCGGDTGFLPTDGPRWEDIECATPYDGLLGDQPADMQKWHDGWLGTQQSLREKWGAKLQGLKDAKQRLEEIEAEDRAAEQADQQAAEEAAAQQSRHGGAPEGGAPHGAALDSMQDAGPD